MTRRTLVIIGLLFVVACAKRATKESSAPAPVSPALASKAATAARSISEASSVASAEAPSPAATRAARQRMIVRTAQVRVVVGDPVATVKALTTLVEAHGGFVSESKQWRDGEQFRVTATFRVPVRELFPTLVAIRQSALRLDSENVSGQDVTEEYADLGAQLTNMEATERELRELLTTVRQRTQRAADVLEVFNQLTKVRSDIDRTKGRIATLEQLAELSTINLELVPDALSKPITEEAWRPITVVREAFRSLLSTLKALAEAFIWLLFYALPVILLLAIPVLLVRRAVRAYRNRAR